MGLRTKGENGELHKAITTHGSRLMGGGCMKDNQFMGFRIRFDDGGCTNSARQSIHGAPNKRGEWRIALGNH